MLEDVLEVSNEIQLPTRGETEAGNVHCWNPPRGDVLNVVEVGPLDSNDTPGT